MARPLLILNERDQRHPAAGGAELHISETARYFAELGYAPMLLCSRFRGAAAEEMQDGLRVRRFGNRVTYYAMLPSAVRRAVGERPGTVIVEHLNKLPFCTPLYSRAPLVLLTHHLFGITAFQQVSFPVACAVYCSEMLIPWVYRGRRFVAVSPSTRDDLVSRGLPESNITVIPNGLDHALYHARGRVAAAQPTILVLGRVEFYKRIELILRAAKQLSVQIPDLKVVVVGDGSARTMLEGLAVELGLREHVHFTGFVPNAKKVDFIRSAHVVANASEKEGWGLTVLEANACGLPAVASNVPGLRDAIRNGETGVLVKHGDVNELAVALRRILIDGAYRERLAAGALAWAQRFDWRIAAYDILAVIEAVGSAATERALRQKTSDSMGGIA